MTEPRGTIYLISRAPIDTTYKHTISFKDASEQLSFWRSKAKISLSNYTYVRRERRFIVVDRTFEEIDGINYLVYQSRSNSKWYYCFVTDREYISDTATRIYFEIDVLQSFIFDYSWKPSYISQAHVDRWDAGHKPIYSRTDEGLHYGSEYVTEAAYKIKPNVDYKHGFYLVYCKQHSELVAEGDASEGTYIYDTPIPYDIYILPSIENFSDFILGTFDEYGNTITIQANNAYTHEAPEIPEEGIVVSDFVNFQKFMMASSIGNFIVQIVYVPYLPFAYNILTLTFKEKEYLNGFNFTSANRASSDGDCALTTTVLKNDDGSRLIRVLKLATVYPNAHNHDIASADRFIGLENALPSSEMWAALKASPYTTERDRRFESKLLCNPYRYNVFTDWMNLPIIIKNEYLCGENIEILSSFGFGFNVPRRYWVKNYRNDPEGREASIMQSIPLEQTIISDAYYTYLLQNKNQISQNIANAKINRDLANASALMGGVAGVAGAAITGNVLGGVGAVADTGMSVIKNNNNVDAMIRSENAKQADISALPDTVTNSNDCSFAITDETKYLTFYRKSITCDFAEQLAQYWHMYGYKVNRVETPNTKSRLRYNYIKTVGANLEGDIESQYMALIKAIYDNGVTLWHYSEEHFKPLDYTYENPERSLLG